MSALKRWRAGTHRVVPPEETVARLRGLLPVLGITRVANVTGLDVIGIPVVMVCRPNARSLAVSQGKGADLACAKASGVMEAIELWHAEHVTAPLKLATRNQLRFTHELADLAGLPRAAGGRFHDDLRTLWIEGVDLLRERGAWVPYELVHTDYTLPLPSGSGSFQMSSSGLASGNHPLEAVSHAIGELVERDAVALWRCRDRAAQARCRLDLDSVDDPRCRELIDRFARARVRVAVWNVTSDVGLAAFQCSVGERAPDPLRPLPVTGGSGCHPVREVALLRALTEAAQSRLTLIAGARDDIRAGDYRAPEVIDRFDDWPEDAPPCRFAEVPTRDSDTLDDDVAWQLARLRAVGIEQVVVVDLTRRELGVPVARVVIPGLEALPDNPHWTPGARARRLLGAAA